MFILKVDFIMPYVEIKPAAQQHSLPFGHRVCYSCSVNAGGHANELSQSCTYVYLTIHPLPFLEILFGLLQSFVICFWRAYIYLINNL